VIPESKERKEEVPPPEVWDETSQALENEEEKIEPSPSKREDLTVEKREFSEITGGDRRMILEIQSESASHTRPIAKRCKRVEDSDSEGSKEEVEMAKPANLKMLHFFAKKQPASPTQKRVVRREAK